MPEAFYFLFFLDWSNGLGSLHRVLATFDIFQDAVGQSLQLIRYSPLKTLFLYLFERLKHTKTVVHGHAGSPAKSLQPKVGGFDPLGATPGRVPFGFFESWPSQKLVPRHLRQRLVGPESPAGLRDGPGSMLSFGFVVCTSKKCFDSYFYGVTRGLVGCTLHLPVDCEDWSPGWNPPKAYDKLAGCGYGPGSLLGKR